MRSAYSTDAFEVKVIAGTHVILFAIKPKSETKDLRGFSIGRTNAGGTPYWLKGIKFFKGTAPNWKLGDTFSSEDQPIQSFFWSDYAASPGTRYEFLIVPRYGAPGALTKGEAIQFEVTTEKEDDGRHGVWFNRGVVATNKFATEYQNQRLTEEMADDVTDDGKLNNKVANWLSRGLAEACLNFINSAKAGEALRVCAYEFTWLPVLKALERALARGVDVKIVYHAVDDNKAAIEEAGLPRNSGREQILFERTRPQTPHNKFIVKIRNGRALQVWTGSTNLTDTGFMGQTNVGHLITDKDVAHVYLQYWSELSENPSPKNARSNAIRLTPNPKNAIDASKTEAFYSPRIADNMLDWYGQRIKDACSLTMITLPFNVAPQILDGLDKAQRPLRLAILENEPTEELHKAEIANKGKLAFSNGAILGKTFVHLKRFGGAKVAPIPQGNLDKWFIDQELARPYNKGYVFFVHAKILLIDPLSDDPLICTGSANFSTNSLISNDENMLLIRGEPRVADIYLTELDRIFKHFYDRDALNRAAAQGEKRDHLYLDETSQWIESNFKPGYKHTRMLTFFPEGATDCRWSKNAARDPDPFESEEQRASDKREKLNAVARGRRAGAKKGAANNVRKGARRSAKKAGSATKRRPAKKAKPAKKTKPGKKSKPAKKTVRKTRVVSKARPAKKTKRSGKAAARKSPHRLVRRRTRRRAS